MCKALRRAGWALSVAAGVSLVPVAVAYTPPEKPAAPPDSCGTPNRRGPAKARSLGEVAMVGLRRDEVLQRG